jgi:hypothetical protein
MNFMNGDYIIASGGFGVFINACLANETWLMAIFLQKCGSSGFCVLFLDKAWTEMPHLGLSHDSKWRATRVHVSTPSSVLDEGLQMPIDDVREGTGRLRDRETGGERVVFPVRIEGRHPPREGVPALSESLCFFSIG